jgi:hypothetical protein
MSENNSSSTPDKSTNQDDQNFEIEIDKIYSEWIGPIDNIRSFVNIGNNFEIKKSYDVSYMTGISKLLKMETSVQESRCHAFFRLIGLPVISNDNKSFYNPGFDITESPNNMSNADKLNIAKNPMDGFNKLSDARERFTQDSLAVFSKKSIDKNNANSLVNSSVAVNVNAGALALSSGGTEKLRRFVAPLDNIDPFNMIIDDQSYDVNSRALVEKRLIFLNEYQDQNGNYASIKDKRNHIIKPFIVDARIDYTVTPQSRLVAVPFTLEASNAKVSATETVVRPILEKIIRDRLNSKNAQDTVGTNVKSVMDYVESIPSIKDKFINSINTIKAMAIKLVDCKRLINTAQGWYYWVPNVSKFGPEGGSSVYGIFLPTVINEWLVTKLDKDILDSHIKSIVRNINSQSSEKLEFPVPTTSFGPDTASGLGDNNAKNSESLLETRLRILTKASDALKTIEIIMGEFSGLGLCDIIAIISALNIMELDKLIGLLDDAAFKRLKISMKLKEAPPRDTDIVSCITELTNKVREYYNIMDKIYIDELSNGGPP